MATPKKKTISKKYFRDLQLDFYNTISINDLDLRIKRAMAEIETEMENDGLDQDIINKAYSGACIQFNREYRYGSDPDLEVSIAVDAKITRMETMREAMLREKRAERAKKTKEENERKKKEQEMKILERLRNKYGI